MSIDLYVDLDELTHLQASLRSLLAELIAADADARIADGAESMGSPDVADALRRFASRWEGGRRQTIEQLRAAEQLVGLAIAEYGAAETHLRSATEGRTA